MTKYYFSKAAILLTSFILLITICLFLTAAIFLYVAKQQTALIICLSFFILFLTTLSGFYRRVKFYLGNTPALILTKDELTDNINLQKFKWSEIKSISSETTYTYRNSIRYIAISLVNPENHIRAIPNPYKRFIARINEKYFGGAFSIQPNIIKCDRFEIVEQLNSYYTGKI